MGDSCTALEFPVAELAGEPGVYAIRFLGRASAPIGGHLRQHWTSAWEKAGWSPPPLIILDDLEPRLANEEFRMVGLLRIAAGQ